MISKKEDPALTMEQHVFNYYKKQFGLNTIVVKSCYQLALSLQHYKGTNVFVKLFIYILKNQIDEIYLQVFS